MVPQEQRKPGFIDAASSKFQHRLRGFGFRSGELASIHFEKQDSHYEARALISVDKGMVLDDASSISSRHFDDVRTRVSTLLARTC